MFRPTTSLLYLTVFFLPVCCYNLLKDYSGLSFFDDWDFYGQPDDLTFGNVNYLNRDDAYSNFLAYINAAGNAVMKVDNSSNVTMGENRNSIRITSQDLYDIGSLWIIDVRHIPYGCSVWPAFWTFGLLWPNDGEIDIIEGINNFDANQIAIHTTSGCTHTTPPNQLGTSPGGTVADDCSTASGCVVHETKPDSYGAGFAASGGGVFATQFDVTGLFMWYFPRDSIPQSILDSTSTSTIDLSDWGSPSAAYVNSSCDISQFFQAQQIVFDITLCGDWAGVPDIYGPECGNSGPTGDCYTNNVIGPGSPTYDNAYFEVSWLRAYTTGAVPSATTSGQADSGPTSSKQSGRARRNTEQSPLLLLVFLSGAFVTGTALLWDYW